MIAKAPVHQNDPRLMEEPSLASYGCLVTSLREIAETHAGRTLTAGEYLSMYRWLVGQGHVLDEPGRRAFVMDHAAVGKAAQYYLGVPQFFKYVYRHDYDGSGADFGSADEASHFIAQVRVAGWDISHFIHADRLADRLWDPYWPARPIDSVVSLRGYAL